MELTQVIVQSRHLTTLMITHDLEQALKVGNKTILMNQGKVSYVLEGEERSFMNVSQLIALFKQVCGQHVGDVSVLQA